MDLAKQGKSSSTFFPKFISHLPILISFGLVVYLLLPFLDNFNLITSHATALESLKAKSVEEFKEIRNALYLVYILIFIVLGNFLKRNQGEMAKKSKLPLLPGLLSGLILTTYAYEIALFVLNILIFFT